MVGVVPFLHGSLLHGPFLHGPFLHGAFLHGPFCHTAFGQASLRHAALLPLGREPLGLWTCETVGNGSEMGPAVSRGEERPRGTVCLDYHVDDIRSLHYQ